MVILYVRHTSFIHFDNIFRSISLEILKCYIISGQGRIKLGSASILKRKNGLGIGRKCESEHHSPNTNKKNS